MLVLLFLCAVAALDPPSRFTKTDSYLKTISQVDSVLNDALIRLDKYLLRTVEAAHLDFQEHPQDEAILFAHE